MKNLDEQTEMNHEATDIHFEAELQSLLRDSEQTICPEIEFKLATIRQQAITSVSKRSSLYPPKNWFKLPAATAALASVAILLVMFMPGQSVNVVQPQEDPLILSASPDLYEDLEFYQWLAENDDARSLSDLTQ